MTQERVDKILFDQGLVASRAQAQKLVNAQAVKYKLNGQWLRVTKPSLKLDSNVELKLSQIDEFRYVSRAGLKLEVAIRWVEAEFQLSGNMIENALDIGQSTGGFTDCLLQWGVQHVVGVDVGHSQLAETLKNNLRVTSLEGINARHLSAEILADANLRFDMIVMDVSFISQTKIIERLAQFIRPGGYFISLIKPQFEIGKDHISKNGLVKDPSLHQLAVSKVVSVAESVDFRVKKIIDSPILGGDGNKEMLLICCFEPNVS